MPFEFARLGVSIPYLSMPDNQIVAVIVESQKCSPNDGIGEEYDIPTIIKK